MQRISSLELVGKSTLEFDLFNEQGEILYQKGDALTPDILLKLNYIDIYKKTSPAAKEIKPLNISKPRPIITYNRPKPVISEKTSQNLIKGSKNIFDKTFNGDALKYSECTEVSNVILDEVTQKYQNLSSIEQLRVYDEYTYSHNVNVSSISVLLGIIIGMSEKELEDIAIGAFLHDIGKMKVPREILNKPGRLEMPEMTIMRGHTYLGYKHIKQNLDIPDKVARIALDHQEKYSGAGYPNGLKDKEINVYAQITSISDVYDALVSERVYKKGMHPHDALNIILSEGVKSFNPDFLEKFITLTQKSETRDEG